MAWLTYALMTVFFWGVYGVILHKGRGFMPGVSPPTPEGANAGLKAFLFVCIAYCVTGIVAVAVLKARGAEWSFGAKAINWSFVAGLAGALGAFTLVLALGSAGSIYKAAAAAAVMPIVFAGAPIVNACVAMLAHPPEGGFKAIPPMFYLGIVLAAGGGFLVAKFAPTNTGGKKPAAAGAITPEQKH